MFVVEALYFYWKTDSRSFNYQINCLEFFLKVLSDPG